MGLTTRNVAAVLAAGLVLGGCVTKGTFRKAVADQQAALAAEKADRQSADDKATQDVTQLRSDLTSMKTDFGAKISAVEGIHLSREMKQDLRDFDRKGLSDHERGRAIARKYGRKPA